MEDYKYKNITEKIIGCAMKIHRTLGNGFQEVIYQRSLAIEFKNNGINFIREQETQIYYEGYEVGTRRVDFFVENKILVEIKAISEITDTHYAQIINYLTAYQMEIGLLINFGEKSLKFKRFINSKKRLNHRLS